MSKLVQVYKTIHCECGLAKNYIAGLLIGRHAFVACRRHRKAVQSRNLIDAHRSAVT